MGIKLGMNCKVCGKPAVSIKRDVMEIEPEIDDDGLLWRRWAPYGAFYGACAEHADDALVKHLIVYGEGATIIHDDPQGKYDDGILRCEAISSISGSSQIAYMDEAGDVQLVEVGNARLIKAEETRLVIER
jgi:hypothetical protein